MNDLRAFDISLLGLRPGITPFSFHIDQEFMAHFPHSLVQEGHWQVLLQVDRQPTFYQLDFHIQGSVAAVCARCGNDLMVPIDEHFIAYLKWARPRAHQQETLDQDIVYLESGTSHFNVAQLIYEYIALAVSSRPMRCDQLAQPCDAEVLARITASVEASGLGNE